LYIPSSIGYGDVGAGQNIPGGSTLVFEIELLGIGNKKAQQ
jgi:FKBP-type peptidyl-prolyl cis-trans isomerase